MSEEDDQADQKGQADEAQAKREYGCPCGKTYLSYPALFTHVKQKHDGKAPGILTKPKTQKARGRPKIHIDAPEDEMSDGAFNFEQQLQQVLVNVRVNFNEPIKLSEGNRSCQDMISCFLNKISFLKHEHEKKAILCYILELKYFVDKKFGEQFWTEQRPGEIILVVNDMQKQHKEVEKKFPLTKEQLSDITYVFFRWMYKNKWTDHKLIKRSPSELIRPK